MNNTKYFLRYEKIDLSDYYIKFLTKDYILIFNKDDEMGWMKKQGFTPINIFITSTEPIKEGDLYFNNKVNETFQSNNNTDYQSLAADPHIFEKVIGLPPKEISELIQGDSISLDTDITINLIKLIHDNPTLNNWDVVLKKNLRDILNN